MTGVVQLFMMRPSGSVGIVFAILAVVVFMVVVPIKSAYSLWILLYVPAFWYVSHFSSSSDISFQMLS